MALFQIMSDLHLETHPSYRSFKFQQTARYLALLGDIGHVGSDELFTFLEAQLKRYWIVLYLLGNHEPYHLSVPNAKSRMRAFEQNMENLRSQSTIGRFIFLDQTRYDISNSLTILGCTLYSRIRPEQANAVSSRFVDFRDIQNWSVNDHNRAHESDLAWLNAQVAKIAAEEPNRQIAIFTHHSPTIDLRSIHPSHRDGSEVSSGFMTDMKGEECFVNPAVKACCFGHTHFNCDFRDETGKRLLANQKGYYMIPEETFHAERVYNLAE